jgi:hypothetical protein
MAPEPSRSVPIVNGKGRSANDVTTRQTLESWPPVLLPDGVAQ